MFVVIAQQQRQQPTHYCGQRSDANHDVWTRCMTDGERTVVQHPLQDRTSGSRCGVWACAKCQAHMKTSTNHRHSAVRRMMVEYWRSGGHAREAGDSASASSEASSEEKKEDSSTCSHEHELSDPVPLGDKILIVSHCKKCGDMKQLVIG